MAKQVLLAGIILIVAGVSSGGPETRKSQVPTTTSSLVSIAVLDYEANVPDHPGAGVQISEILTVHLSADESLELVERSALGKVLQEQKLALVGLANQDQAANVGKLLGAKLLVMGKAFVMDQKLCIVSRIVGVETGRVVGGVVQVERSKPLSDAIAMAAEDIAKLIRKNAGKLLPNAAEMPDPIDEIRKAAAKVSTPTVAVVIPERHITRIVVDPAAETEIKKILTDCGYKVIDTGKNDLADWAKGMMKEKRPPWPPGLDKVDAIIVGEAFSEFALRTGELVTCTARAEVNVIDRKTGQILISNRQTGRGVDVSEAIAGKTALQGVGHRLGIALARDLLKHPRPAPTSAPATQTGLLDPGHPVIPPVPQPIQLGPPGESGSPGPAGDLGKGYAAQSPPPKPATTSTPARRTIFAVPFENSTGQEQYNPAAAGLGDLVAVMLAQQENVTVVERQRLEALTEEQASSLKGLTGEKYALTAGRLLKADTVLTGRLYLVQGKLNVMVKAMEIATERVLGADECATRPEDLVEASLQMARNLAKAMAIPLPEIDPAKIDKSPIASLHFAKGLSHYYAGNMDAAIMQFMRTIDLDPDHAEAHYWTGMCFSKLGEDDHAIIEWEKFLKRQPGSQYAAPAKELLGQAKEREKHSPVKRLGPTSQATQPKTKEGGK